MLNDSDTTTSGYVGTPLYRDDVGFKRGQTYLYGKCGERREYRRPDVTWSAFRKTIVGDAELNN